MHVCQGLSCIYLWKPLDPVQTDAGFSILPTSTFEETPTLELICIPGGPGQASIMSDVETLAWLKLNGEKAQYVTSVCSGSLLLGAAGLLNGGGQMGDPLRKIGVNPIDCSFRRPR